MAVVAIDAVPRDAAPTDGRCGDEVECIDSEDAATGEEASAEK
jgi:hypothetical protein